MRERKSICYARRLFQGLIQSLERLLFEFLCDDDLEVTVGEAACVSRFTSRQARPSAFNGCQAAAHPSASLPEMFDPRPRVSTKFDCGPGIGGRVGETIYPMMLGMGHPEGAKQPAQSSVTMSTETRLTFDAAAHESPQSVGSLSASPDHYLHP